MRRPVTLSIALVLAVPPLAAAPPAAGGPVQAVGEYTMYFGVVPAALTQGTPHSAGPRDAHGLPRADFAQEHHLLVVAERTADRLRPTDARVSASVRTGGATVERVLEPMSINGVMSYGTVFVLPGPGRYTFDVTVLIPGRRAPLHARYVYTQFHTSEP